MSFTQIYKPGQGKWTRICTAIGVGLVVAYTVIWLLGELEGALGPRQQQSTLTVRGAVAPDQRFTATINYLSLAVGEENVTKSLSVSYVTGPEDKPEDVAAGLKAAILDDSSSMFTASLTPSEPVLTVTTTLIFDFELTGSTEGNTQLVSEKTVSARVGDATYILAAVALVIVGVAGVITWKVLNKPNIVEFMINTETEMRKVNWPSKKEITGSTWVVVCGTLLLTVMIFAADLVFTLLFTAIKVIDTGTN